MSEEVEEAVAERDRFEVLPVGCVSKPAQDRLSFREEA